MKDIPTNTILHTPIFPPNMNKFLHKCALHVDTYAERLIQQMACGRQKLWTTETFTSLPLPTPNQHDIYILLLETPPTVDPIFPPTGLDMYCGQAGGFAPNSDDWLGLPLRLMKYEKMQRADYSKQVTLRNERNEHNTQSKTLHIYMLCSHPDV